jgi:hypothetical protein
MPVLRNSSVVVVCNRVDPNCELECIGVKQNKVKDSSKIGTGSKNELQIQSRLALLKLDRDALYVKGACR